MIGDYVFLGVSVTVTFCRSFTFRLVAIVVFVATVRGVVLFVFILLRCC